MTMSSLTIFTIPVLHNIIYNIRILKLVGIFKINNNFIKTLDFLNDKKLLATDPIAIYTKQINHLINKFSRNNTRKIKRKY